MCCLVNIQRTQVGLPPMGLDDRPNQAAQLHSQEQDNTGVSQFSADGRNPIERVAPLVGAGWTAIGQNVAGRFPDETSVMNAWMNSPPHRADILGDYNCLGFGEFDGVWTQNFAKLPISCAVPTCSFRRLRRRDHANDVAGTSIGTLGVPFAKIRATTDDTANVQADASNATKSISDSYSFSWKNGMNYFANRTGEPNLLTLYNTRRR
ncbi:hypothetical protein M427DRAFT_154415 [Gonapodya prolifera JEL478]|uniref:SCP domain-containing protein n=1 Tax=Gonapodya prolifera (strain JEL478) TaxID=1344416 RepID=A0A139AI60_GONPJ|nr:hypothetical protein M427DRAFT_154415 [Gonapodya prolifera JEL478]|eukprot:KXS16477.1 hypothetical protein M427DRAFT_154415 [Gonapodya prolifera JEL478]